MNNENNNFCKEDQDKGWKGILQFRNKPGEEGRNKTVHEGDVFWKG